MSWNRILIAAMGAFILFIVAMGIKMATSNEALYETDYYEQGEKHAERMVQEKVAEQVSFEYNATQNNFTFTFDSLGFIEELKLVHLAGTDTDSKISSTDKAPSATKTISVKNLKPGVWMLEAKGEVNSEPFFIKKQFVK